MKTDYSKLTKQQLIQIIEKYHDERTRGGVLRWHNVSNKKKKEHAKMMAEKRWKKQKKFSTVQLGNR